MRARRMLRGFGAHARAQAFQRDRPPMIASFEPGETWGWCYVDHRYFDPMPGRLPKRRSGLAAFLSRLVGR